jgi:hypothetical protein
MSRDVLSDGHKPESIVKRRKTEQSVHHAQDLIYRFLLDIVKKSPPEDVLQEFKRLFIYYEPDATNTIALHQLSNIIFFNNEEEFKNTLKRSCYILINNWDAARNYKPIKELVELFSDLKISQSTLSPTLSRLRKWLFNFVNSKDFQDIKLFSLRHEEPSKVHWSQRYTSYLLVPQYVDLSNPIEQREAARAVSQKMKERFKFDLAMYTARSQSAVSKESIPKNPTNLGDDVLRVVKVIIAKRGRFSYKNLANIFLSQTNNILYKDFKKSLQNYLVFAIENPAFVETLSLKLSEKLEFLYKDYNDNTLDGALLLRTCNRIIEYLTTENYREPSSLFILLISKGSPLTLVILLLKIVLICKNSRTHLETCIAGLIEYYQHYPEEDCQWMIGFMEIFNITFAIYAENVQYNLIKMNEKMPDEPSEEALEAYRVFSQLKSINEPEVTLDIEEVTGETKEEFE